MNKRKHRKKNRKLSAKSLSVLLMAILLLFSALPVGQHFWTSALERSGLQPFAKTLPELPVLIHMLDVGKADAILVETDAAAMLVDCGTAAEAKTVIQYLEDRGIQKLDCIWISHTDADHVGGLEQILEALPCDVVYCAEPLTLPENTACRQVCPGERYNFGALTCGVIGPRNAYASGNDRSMVLRMEYDAFSMLFCGDIEREAEQDLLASGENLAATVLKVAHHGSDTSTSEAFLSAVSPEYALISSGEDRNLLPRNVVLKRLQDQNVAVYRTDQNGTVVLGTDGESVQVFTERLESSKG